MRIPILQSLVQRLGQFVKGFKPTSFESQRAELFPPRFDQVQPTGVLRDELNLNFWLGCQDDLHLFTGMDRQVIFNQQPMVGRKLNNPLLQQLNMGDAISPRAHQDRCLPAGWLQVAMHPQLATPAIIWFEGGSVGCQLPFFAGVGLDRNRPQLIQADYPGAFWRRQIGCYDTPRFSTNSGSGLSASWNQRRSSKTRCKCLSVHNSWGCPSIRDFCVARVVKVLRTSDLWIGCRPARSWYSNPGRPFLLNRLTPSAPIALLLKPTLKPASVACRSESSYMKTITRARWARRIGSLRDEANCLIAVTSLVVKVRSLIGFRIRPPGIDPRSIYFNSLAEITIEEVYFKKI